MASAQAAELWDSEEQGKYTEEDYYSIPEDVRAELINGQIYYQASPSRKHQEVLTELLMRIGDYIKSKNGECKVYPGPFAVRLSEKTVVEPDISIICDKDKLTDRGCTGAPDWIIEIVSPGNPGNDYVRKLNLYLDSGVREYWIVEPIGETVSVYRLEKKEIRAEEYTFKDKIKAGIYEDLWIDFKEISL